jgi:hypothetical protein
VNRSEFEAELRKLVSAQSKGTVNVGCLACERCERCTDSTFCSDSRGLARSHYCTSCDDCTDCAHCSKCSACLGCTHCIECERCTGSAYLVKSVGCSGCTYCFGCVGLAKKDFHILNRPYDRKTYFETVAKLARELGVKLP